MFTIDSRGITSAYSMICEVFMGIIIPIPFFPVWMKKISDVLPFRFIGDFPYRAYSGNIDILEGKTLLLGSFIWIIIAITFGFILSKIALKKAVIQGG
jgi:ABC-2 type transport system permease protein